MTTPEGAVKADVKKFLHLWGCIAAGSKENNWPTEPRGWYYMPQSNGMGTPGIPDFVGVHDGQFFAIETKAPGKRNNTSPNQDRRIKELLGCGALVIVIDDVSQLEGFFS